MAAKATVTGTLAIVVSLELRLIVRPPGGAGAERFSVRFWVATPVIVNVVGKKLRVSATFKFKLPAVYPGAETVRVADPKFTPFTCGGGDGVFCPLAMVMLLDETETVVGSLLVRVTATPSDGAGAGKLIAKGAD